MKVITFRPDQEGICYLNNIAQFLGCSIENDQPVFWAAVDELHKGANMVIVCKKNDQTFDSELLPSYITTLNNGKGAVWHLFRAASKIITAKL